MGNKSITKEELSGLENVKLIIGNGFDKFCNVHSLYSEFFEYCKNINNEFNLFRKCLYQIKEKPLKEYISEIKSRYSKDSKLYKLNIWSLFFYLNSKKYNSKEVDIKLNLWCDIETSISSSFNDEPSSNSKICWPNIYNQCIHLNKKVNLTKSELIIFSFISLHLDFSNQITKEQFYNYLFLQLNKFEKMFGKFIKLQTSSKTYKNNFLCTLKKLSNNNVSIFNSIDTFNYSKIDLKDLNLIVNHINGNVSNPIFGVDMVNDNSKEYIKRFTKTNRQLLLSIRNKLPYINVKFKNVIIFGHSLNINDYSYFFKILDLLPDDGLLIFAFSYYNDNNEQIERNLIYNVTELLNNYEKEMLNSNTKRLPSSLRFENRIRFLEIKNDSIEKISEADNLIKEPIII